MRGEEKKKKESYQLLIKNWPSRANYSEVIVEATINPKILAGISDYLTAATYSDMNIAITNFNFNLNP